MSNTVITNYTDLNGPSTKADSSVVVIVNKDGSLSVDQNLLGTLMGTDGSQGAGISVVRVGHEGRPDDATDSESDDDKVPHVTLSVDSYYDEPSSIIKYDSGAEMLQSLRIETRENSLVGFQNDHCYTPLTSPGKGVPKRSDSFSGYDEPVIEITHTPPPKPMPLTPQSKKIKILEQKILPKGKKIIINPTETAVLLKGNDVLNKPLPVLSKTKQQSDEESSENSDSSSISSGDSIPDRDSDSDYKETRERPSLRSVRKIKTKPRILQKVTPSKGGKIDTKASKLKPNKQLLKRDIKERVQQKGITERKHSESEILVSKEIITLEETTPTAEISKTVTKQTPKSVKKEKRTPSHVTALLSDMTSLFSTPDVIRKVSTDGKTPNKPEKEPVQEKKQVSLLKTQESIESSVKNKPPQQKTYLKQKDKVIPVAKGYDLIPQLDDASLAQILQDTTGITTIASKIQPSPTIVNTMNSPGLAGPLSPTLDLLGGIQPEEEGLSEDLLMHVAQLVESSENLQEVIDKQMVVLPANENGSKGPVQAAFLPQQALSAPQPPPEYAQTPTRAPIKSVAPRKDPIEIVRRDGRVITLPPIEAPATRSAKRKSQLEGGAPPAAAPPPAPAPQPQPSPAQAAPSLAPQHTLTPEPQLQHVSKQYINRKLTTKKPELPASTPHTGVEKISAESQESLNSEDDPYRLWCICKQPHNNRFMICCDGCEEWFHGKCVNITKAMGQQMEEQGVEWRCPNCQRKAKHQPKAGAKALPQQKKESELPSRSPPTPGLIPKDSNKTSCIVCKRPARPSSIYCSDSCILKHAQDSLGAQTSPSKADSEPGKAQDKPKGDSRVIVYERKTGRVLAGTNAPTAENLKSWLQRNPTFEVVRPGTLHPTSIPPNLLRKKQQAEGNKIQTTLNFARVPRKSGEQQSLVRSPQTPQTPEPKERPRQMVVRDERPRAVGAREERPRPVGAREERPRTIVAREEQFRAVGAREERPRTFGAREERLRAVGAREERPRAVGAREERAAAPYTSPPPRPSTSTAPVEPRKPARKSRSNSSHDKTPAVTPSTSRRKETPDAKKKMDSTEPIRENVRKSLAEQMGIRMSENKGRKFSEDEIQQFAVDTERELYELFAKDVGMKYKAKYRSLMFNIKDRKNRTLWEKICDKKITPQQLVRLSPEEMASQELAQWREEESKHQLELIKKSEIDLLAASKTYVLKTHKGEEVMETKESVQTELDPEVAVEDLVTALNDSTVGEEVTNEVMQEKPDTSSKPEPKHSSSRKRERERSSARHKKKKRDSRRESESKKSKSSRRRSDTKEDREERLTRRSDKRASRARSGSKDRAKDKEKASSSESERSRRRSRSRSRSRTKARRRSKSRARSRSKSRVRSRSKSRARSRTPSPAPAPVPAPAPSSRRRSSRHKPRSPVLVDDKQRSRSQEHVVKKSKNDSPDSEIERPKSAMLKEVHPEYDPHEPMITSAFSEEDLRKSGAEGYEDAYKGDIVADFDADYDPTKSFLIDTSVILPMPQEKVSEAESDQEPSSTVEHSAATVWNGCINMVDVARFYVAAHEVSGSGTDLEEDLTAELDIVGRINPDTVWEYIGKMKRAVNKDIVVLRLQAANDEEKMQYIALYSYLSSRNRLGVVKVSNTTAVKDIYIVPLAANTALPRVLLPVEGPGLGDARGHLLLAIVIRQRKKRPATTHIAKEVIPAKVARESRKRSYTPPLALAQRAAATTATPAALPVAAAAAGPHPAPASRPLLPAAYTSPALSTSVKDKIAASLAAADDEEAYSPGSSCSAGSGTVAAPAPAPPAPAPPADKLRCKMAELNRQIEEQKQQIMKMAQADSSSAPQPPIIDISEEAYSPSRPMTPPPPVVPLADIALPSNLQEILATIKQRSETNTDVDMRSMPLPP